jgi:hypothetical protein
MASPLGASANTYQKKDSRQSFPSQVFGNEKVPAGSSLLFVFF